jgi:hypothetical protein
LATKSKAKAGKTNKAAASTARSGRSTGMGTIKKPAARTRSAGSE